MPGGAEWGGRERDSEENGKATREKGRREAEGGLLGAVPPLPPNHCTGSTSPDLASPAGILLTSVK